MLVTGRFLRIVGAVVAATVGLPGSVSAQGEDDLPGQLYGFDPGAAVTSLAAANEGSATAGGASAGLATPMEVDRQFGAITTSIPIELPQGRRLTPNVTLRYSSNGPNSALGQGWDLQLGCVKRNTTMGVPFDYAQATPIYKNAAGFTLVMAGGTVDLDTPLPSSGNCSTPWGASSEETWLFACFDEAGNKWTVRDKEGTLYTYGFIEGGAHPETRMGFDINSATGTFAWMLTRVEDLNGNAVRFEYSKDLGHSYPTLIHYGGNGPAGHTDIFHVEIVIVSRPPSEDPTISYRGGFREEIAKRISAIKVWVDGYSTAAQPTRQYNFTYTQDPDTNRSLLQEVSLSLADGTEPPPPTTFAYSTLAHEFGETEQPLGGVTPVDAFSFSGGGFVGQAFMDVTGDGMPDYVGDFLPNPNLRMRAFEGKVTSLYGNEATEFTELQPGGAEWGAPYAWDPVFAFNSVSSSWSRLIDMDGDTLPDFVRSPPTFPEPNEPLWAPQCCDWSDNGSSCANLPCVWEVFRNSGDSMQHTPMLWPGAPAEARNYVGGQRGLQTDIIDLTGDGCPDLIDCENVTWQSGWVTCNLRPNTGNGFGPGIPWEMPALDAFNLLRYSDDEETDHDLLDINGDGLPDKVSISNFGEVAFNNGHGFDPLEPWPGMLIHQTAEVFSTSVALRDMNGDGLPDRVVGTPSGWQVAFNTGGGFSAAVSWGNAEGYLQDKQFSILLSAVGTLSDVLDINGDGLADRIVTSGAKLAAGPPPNLMVRLENSLGARWEANYRESKSTDVYLSPTVWEAFDVLDCAPDCPHILPFPAWVARDITRDPNTTALNDELTINFNFNAPYFDRTTREFRGFREQQELATNSGRQVTRVFAPPPFEASTSLAWPAASWPGGEVPSRPFRLVYEKVTDTGVPKPATTSTTDWEAASAGDGRYLLRPNKTVRTDRPKQASTDQQATTQIREYDAYNNVITETLSGSTTALGTTIAVGPITTTATYFPDSPCPGLPTEVIIWEDQGSNMALSRRAFGYDSQKCNLQWVRAYLAPAGQSAMTGAPQDVLTVHYDPAVDPVAAAAGMATRLEDARGFSTTLKYNIAGNYDCGQLLFPCSVSNAKGHTTTSIFDLRWGKPVSNTDANGAVTQFSFDGLGRPTGVVRPLDSETCEGEPCNASKFAYFFGSPGVPTRIETKVREPNAAGGYRSINAFFDALARPLGTKERRYVDQMGKVVSTDAVFYDFLGRVKYRYVPFEAQQGLDVYEGPPAGLAKTELIYDGLDRVTKTKNPDGTYKTADFSIAGQTTIRDENYNECATPTGKTASCPGIQRTEMHDALGRTRRIEDHEGPFVPISSTTNVHDAMGRVIESTVTDEIPPPSGPLRTATTSFEFDTLGRRTAMHDPDSGTWTYEYDQAGNLIYQNDPKWGQSVALCYDLLNRLTRKSYLTQDTSTGINWGNLCNTVLIPEGRRTDYTYDTGSYGIGRLRQVRDESPAVTEPGWSAQTVLYYDERGRVVSQDWERTVDLSDGSVKTLTASTNFTYDAADRMLTVDYPGNSSYTQTVSNTFADTGQLQGVFAAGQTFAGNSVYNLFGQLTAWRDGSGLQHTAEYYDQTKNFRLKRLRVYDPVSSDPNDPQNTNYLSLQYSSYDVAGNLKQINDLATYSSPSLHNSWTYGHDGLGRLKSAQWATDPAMPFAYDGIGNMTAGNGLTFGHDYSGEPHQMTAMEDGTPQSVAPEYDDNGALEMIPETADSGARVILYDADGRVGSVFNSTGHAVRSIYDFAGQRVARIVDEGGPSESVTFYFGRWFEVTDDTLTRHIYMGDRLIAESPVPAPFGWSLAANADAKTTILLARMMSDAVRTRPHLYPVGYLSTDSAVLLATTLLALMVVLMVLPWKVRLGLVGRVHRGRVAVVIVVFSLTLTPLPLVRPVVASGGGGSGGHPAFPVFFLHTDHLGSTLAVSCHNLSEEGCDDREVLRYYRYSAYGQMKVYDASGTEMASNDSPIDRMYTGQVWDDAAQMYYYNARFYDPKAARFLTTDPAREYTCPYAYVLWNPTRLTDPTGMLTVPDAGGAFALQYLHAMSVLDRGWEALLAWRAPGRGGLNGPNGGGPGGGAGQEGLFAGGDALQMVRALSIAAKAGANPAKVVLRSYAPWQTFGFIFGGDPNTDTARLKASLDFDPASGRPVEGPLNVEAGDTTTLGGYFNHGTSGDASGGVATDGTNTTLSVSGSNGLFRGYNPIELEVALDVRLFEGQLSATLSGKPFPNAEAMLQFSDGNTVTLAAWHLPNSLTMQHLGPVVLLGVPNHVVLVGDP